MSVWVGQDWDKDHGKGCILASISPADGLQGGPLRLPNEMKSWTCPAGSQPSRDLHPHSCAPGSGRSCHGDAVASVASGWQEE